MRGPMPHKNYLVALDGEILELVKLIGVEAQRLNMSSYIVGGIVRDLILRADNLDLDIVVDKDAVVLAKHLAEMLNAEIQSYELFKTATLTLPSARRIDIATVRKEAYPKAGQLPVVKEGSLKDDLLRRDFTINAMAISITPSFFGKLIDEYKGMNDLKKGLIRILHDQSFRDDPTRILRAVRFEERYGFKIESKTLSLMREALREKYAQNVKPPRYFSEFKKILKEKQPVKYLKRLYDMEGLKFLDVDKVDFYGLKRLESNFKDFKKKQPISLEYEDWFLYLMAVLKNKKSSHINALSRKFHLRKEEEVSLLQSSKKDIVIKELSPAKLKTSEICDVLRVFNLDVVVYFRLMADKENVKTRIDEYLYKIRMIKLDITGEDLSGLGVPQGRKMKEILTAVLKEKIDRSFNNKYQELNEVQLLIKKMK